MIDVQANGGSPTFTFTPARAHSRTHARTLTHTPMADGNQYSICCHLLHARIMRRATRVPAHHMIVIRLLECRFCALTRLLRMHDEWTRNVASAACAHDAYLCMTCKIYAPLSLEAPAAGHKANYWGSFAAGAGCASATHAVRGYGSRDSLADVKNVSIYLWHPRG
jgi:hypothetical protein